jgi:hypothetical protein
MKYFLFFDKKNIKTPNPIIHPVSIDSNKKIKKLLY